MKAVERARQKGVAFLESIQLPVAGVARDGRAYKTIFAPAIVLAALQSVESSAALRAKLAAWLLQQKSDSWAFNYWAMDVPERQVMPYPDDLDDTFCALSALRLQDASLVGEAALGRIVHLLVALESQVGGPYRTWLAPKNAPAVWHDVDLAVNVNIAYFLRLTGTALPNITAMMEEGIRRRLLQSPYYPSLYPLVYFVARTYEGPLRPQLAQWVHGLQTGVHWQTPMQTALALIALYRLEGTAPSEASVAYLLAEQQPDGSWPAELFCVDPVHQGHNYRTKDDSAATVTALVLEALSLGAAGKPQARHGKEVDDQARKLEAAIYAAAQEGCNTLGREAAAETKHWLKRMEASEHSSEITLLPYLFAQGLATAAQPSPEVLMHLGLANLYGWLAYTIVDNFLDDEGRPRELPVATMALRRSLQHFAAALPNHTAYQCTVSQAFDTIDSANAWELAHCRFALQNGRIAIARLPSYRRSDRLYGRSLGHALTPLGVLVAVNVVPDSAVAQRCMQASQHYLAARQLVDDLHDWEEDLRAGRVSYVVAACLQDMQQPVGGAELDALIADMRPVFWHSTMLRVVGVAERHLALSRQLFMQSGLLTGHNAFLSLLDRLEATLQRTRQEQARAEDFLQAYRRS